MAVSLTHQRPTWNAVCGSIVRLKTTIKYGKDMFADRLIEKILEVGNPCIVGLDPRIEFMPDFVKAGVKHSISVEEDIRHSITAFHERILGISASLVPAVKLQIAFYEQYGIPGLLAFQDTINIAKRLGLVVIADVKRNDIASTAAAYARAFLGEAAAFGVSRAAFDVDCITVSPYLGVDSLEPFVEVCTKYGKGLFVLVKTSNPGSSDFQDLLVNVPGGGMRPLFEVVAQAVDRFSNVDAGTRYGYSSIGAVVAATFPEQAKVLRGMMEKSVLLVPGYGSQGATGDDAAPCFDRNGLGAVVSASRSITYDLPSLDLSEAEFDSLVEARIKAMITDLKDSLERQGLNRGN